MVTRIDERGRDVDKTQRISTADRVDNRGMWAIRIPWRNIQFTRERTHFWWMAFIGNGLSEEQELMRLHQLLTQVGMPWHACYSMYLKSQRWKRLRQTVIARDGGACVRCQSTERLNVDHMRYPEVFGLERLEDLQTLCFECHCAKTTTYDLRANSSRKKVRGGEDGADTQGRGDDDVGAASREVGGAPEAGEEDDETGVRVASGADTPASALGAGERESGAR